MGDYTGDLTVEFAEDDFPDPAGYAGVAGGIEVFVLVVAFGADEDFSHAYYAGGEVGGEAGCGVLSRVDAVGGVVTDLGVVRRF